MTTRNAKISSNKQSGLTLTELLVSTILMGIVMAGIAAFSLFIKQARDTTSAGSILAMQTTTAMHYMMEDANRAVGDSGDRGIVVDAPGGVSICFRHDTNNPASYADDTWACYWYDNASDALWKCATRVVAAGAPPADFNDCKTGGQGSGAMSLVTLNPAAAQYFSVVDADGRLGYIDITLNTIANPNRPAHTLENPTYRLFTRLSPPAHGR